MTATAVRLRGPGQPVAPILPTPEADKTWRNNAACKDSDPERQQPEPGDRAGIHRAKQTCKPCPVAAQCLFFALAMDERHGVWGGLTAAERDRLKDGQTATRCAGCQLWHVSADPTATRCAACPVIPRRVRNRGHQKAAA